MDMEMHRTERPRCISCTPSVGIEITAMIAPTFKITKPATHQFVCHGRRGGISPHVRTYPGRLACLRQQGGWPSCAFAQHVVLDRLRDRKSPLRHSDQDLH